MFYTVGMLREILKDYPDDTTLYVNEAPGLVYFDEKQRWIDLQNIYPDDDDYPVSDIESPAMVGAEYMDF